MDDLLLFVLIDASGVLVELHQILNVVGSQREDEGILAGVDDGRGLSGNFLAAHKVLDVLGDNDLHTVVFPDALCQLEHEVQSDRELGVDKDVGLVNDHHNLSMQTVFQVVIPVLDDLIVDVLEHQQHLGIGNGGVPVCQHGLEVEDREIGIRRDRAGAVPYVGIPPAGGELGNVVHQRSEHGADILVIRILEFRQNGVVEVVKDRIVLRSQPGEIGLRRDLKPRIEPIHHAVQILHGVLIAVRQNLPEELLQKLEVGGIGPAGSALPRLVIIQSGDDVEGIEPPIHSVAHIDDLPVEVTRQLGILILRVQHEDLGVIGGQVGQDGLSRV